jgi:hypothetical protein
MPIVAKRTSTAALANPSLIRETVAISKNVGASCEKIT